MIEREAFKVWLESKGSSIVGWSRVPSRCPLATYLMETTGIRYAVGFTCYTPATTPDEAQDTPSWADEFILALDNHFDFEQPVLGTAALKILEGIR